MRISRSVATVVVLLALLPSGTARAAKIVVSPGAGTPVQDAIDAAAPGDILQLAVGTYPEAIVVDKPLTLRGPANFIDVACVHASMVTIAADDVSLDRIYVEGGSVANIAVHDSNRVRIRNSSLRPNNFADDCPVDARYGINVVASTRVTVEANDANDSLGLGFYREAFIRLASIPGGAKIRVRHNFVNFDNMIGILVEDSTGVLDRRRMSTGLVVVKNSVVSSSSGIVLRNTLGILIDRNYVAGANTTPGIGIDLDADSAGNLIRHNLLVANSYNARDLGFGNCWQGNTKTPGFHCAW